MKGKKKTEIITARLTPSEKAAIQKRAQRAGMTVTDYLIHCGLGKRIVQIDSLQEVLSELKAQGRNINQLTVLANMGRVNSLQVEDLINAYRKIYSSLETIAKGGEVMATFVAIKNTKQTVGALAGVLKYVAQERKTRRGDFRFVSGHNCVPQCAYTEMLATKRQSRKTDGRQFYHFVQSFSDDDCLTPQEANAIGLEFAEREFAGFEVVIATHLDTGHLHNHLVVNSVSCVDGKKLHQNAADLQAHRNANDAVCQRHGLSVLKKAKRHEPKKSMKPGEYQAGLRGESWKLDLILAINEALEYADDRESFIYNIEQEGYQVVWTDTKKNITFITPEGRRCRESSLHDETFLKQNLEMLFLYRQVFGFTPATEEPDEGWLGELANDAVRFGRYLEQAFDTPDLPPIPTWSESKQRSREALKKLAHGQKLTNEESYGYDFGW